MVSNEYNSLLNKQVGDLTIIKYIASGSFGHVFEGHNNKTGKKVAIKVPITTTERSGLPSLKTETAVYKDLQNPSKGISRIEIVSIDKSTPAMVLQLLGKSLETVIKEHNKLCIRSVIFIALQMLDTIRHIHSYGYIHRDLKPDNFAVSLEDKTKIFCLDFGLAKQYLDDDNVHIAMAKNKRFVGTARYASVNTHNGIEQSRRDDLESIGYILVYLFKGKLPWQGIKHPEKKKRYQLIKKKKENVSIDELCKGMPNEFIKYMYYVKSLEFDEKPHYTALKKMFQRLLDTLKGISTDLEWIDDKKS